MSPYLGDKRRKLPKNNNLVRDHDHGGMSFKGFGRTLLFTYMYKHQ